MLLLRRTMMCTAILLAAVLAADALAARGGGRSGSFGGGRSGSHAASGAGHAARSGSYHGHRGVGVYVVPRFGAGVVLGAPLLAPRYYGYAPPPYPYYPMPLVVEPTGQVYIEQDQGVQTPGLVVPEQSSSWYYCAASNAYYPYVQDCPGGWQPVAPQSSQ